MRLLTLPDSNPASVLAHTCRLAFVTKFPSPLYKVFHQGALSFPSDLEILHPLPLPPNFLPSFTTIIPESKESALDAYNTIANNKPDLHIFTDGSSTEDGVGVAAIDLSSEWSSVVRIGDPNQNSIFEAELTGVRRALGRLAHLEEVPPNVVIFSDSQSVIKTLERRPSHRPGQHIVLDIHSKLSLITDLLPRIRIHLQWVPGHQEIKGNKAADSLARKTTKRKDAAPPSPFPFSPSSFA
ncbi:ribonuclease H-like protein [Atractiella rhizophila]|nr:ribonuclease H-like protein [Atractiella rhizophila]